MENAPGSGIARLASNGTKGERRRRRSSEDDAATSTAEVTESAKRCPACGSVTSRRNSRTLADRLRCKAEVRRCLECDAIFWIYDVDRIRTAALMAIAASCLFLVVFSVLEFAPPRPIAAVPQSGLDLRAPRTNRLGLTPEQNRALLRQIQGEIDFAPHSQTR